MLVNYRLEGLDFGLLPPVVDGVLHVVDGQPAVGCLELVVAQLRHPLVAPILGAEIQDGGPVVGKVLAELAAGAGGFGGEISCGIHGRVEGVLLACHSQLFSAAHCVEERSTNAADDLMDMARRNRTRVDQGVDSLNHQLGAVESHHPKAGCGEAESEDSVPAHRGCTTGSSTSR